MDALAQIVFVLFLMDGPRPVVQIVPPFVTLSQCVKAGELLTRNSEHGGFRLTPKCVAQHKGEITSDPISTRRGDRIVLAWAASHRRDE